MKSVFFKISCIFFLTILHFDLVSQVNIDVKINDINDTILYLMKYKSDKTQIIINSSTIASGNKTFKSPNNYDEGIYVIADSKQNPIFEILIGNDQKFSIHVKELMDLDSYKVKGCKETLGYFKIYSKTIHENLYIKALESEIEHFPDNAKKIDSIKKELYEYQESMLSKDQSSFLNTYIKYIEEKPATQYFEDLPLCDTRVLNSRLLKNKLDEYFNNYMSEQNPDIICQNIDNIISRTNDCHEVRDYILWYLYSKYFDNDLIYIHLSDNYFSKLEINNLTENIRNKIIKRGNILRDITIGSLSPTFSYIDDNGNQINLEEIKGKNIILFFYKPDCQRCIRDKRILRQIKEREKYLRILYIDISEDNYSNVSQDIINQYDITVTPTIYVLDKEKKIIAKNIKAEEIEFHLIKE